MAKVGAGNALLLPRGRILFSASATLFASNVSAHGGQLNAEDCPHNRKHGGYHCHRSSAWSSRIDGFYFQPRFASSRVARGL